VTCVKGHFAPFQIDIVDRKPSRGDYITAVVGGRASMLGLNDRNTNGVGPYSPNRVLRTATVHVFSKVGTGERDVKNLCAVTVHETAHALGLDHTYKCGDIMSYFLDRCGPRKILDVEAPCGEDSPRRCGDGKQTQNSYRKLAQAVGLRKGQPEPEPEPEPEPDDDVWHDDGYYDDGHGHGHDHDYGDEIYDEDDPWADEDRAPQPQRKQPTRKQPAPKQKQKQPTRKQPEPADPYEDDEDAEAGDVTYVRDGYGNLYSVEQREDRRGNRYLVIRRVQSR
jgi:hypothetical protein